MPEGERIPQEQDPQEVLQKVSFHYLKNPNYRTVHVDGAHGGLTPQRLFDISFYTERFPIPTKTVHTVSPDGKLLEEVERHGKDGIIREIEFNVVMNLKTAKAIADFIYAQLNQQDLNQ